VPALVIFIIFIITASLFVSSAGLDSLSPVLSQEQKPNQQEITLMVMLDDQGDPPRLLKMLFEPALKELQAKHPKRNIKLDYRPIPYLDSHPSFLQSMANDTTVDIMTVDYIWLGEFVERGLLTDITNYTKSWERASEWYQSNWDGGSYKDKIYGIWTVADARGIWYWKDLLQQAGVNSTSLNTWNGGAIIENRPGHPTKELYWFPGYNSSEGVRALEFVRDQIDAGVKPQKEHFWGKEFLDRRFAVMIEALQNHVHLNTSEQKKQFEKEVGFIPGFPVPSEGNQSATLLGGWLLSIPSTSKNKDLAWELITLVLQPKILAPFHQKYGLLPTQIPIGEGIPYSTQLNQTVPYYEQLISMLELQGARPNIPEYPEIATHIKQAIDQVYNGTKEPKQALDEAAAKSAKVLGW
jgi:multiple sugar transport system substrate-binding protein